MILKAAHGARELDDHLARGPRGHGAPEKRRRCGQLDLNGQARRRGLELEILDLACGRRGLCPPGSIRPRGDAETPENSPPNAHRHPASILKNTRSTS